MENIMRIKAESRTETGKQVAKKIRAQGKVPAIIYGGQKESIPISLLLSDIKAILKSEKGENTVLKIQRDDIEVDAMLKEVQMDYLSDNIIHVDFLRIDLDKPVVINVPIHIKGEPIGVKTEDGLFDFMTREVRVKCLPTLIPTEYVLDVSDLHTYQSIKAEDIELGDGIDLVIEPQVVICAVAGKAKADEEEEELEEEGEETAAEEPAEGESE